MAYYKITSDKRGKLKARIQVSGKDIETGKSKVFAKQIYNIDGLTEAKFRKQVEKISIEFEEEVLKAYEYGTSMQRTNVLTFTELMHEWQENIKSNLSISYYVRAQDVEVKFVEFLTERKLVDKPISVITVRDVQMFLNSFAQKGYNVIPTVKLKQSLPKTVNFRELSRENIINRNTSYGMQKRGKSIEKETAINICNFYNLRFDDYFEILPDRKQYSTETIKGYRRILRTLFNEALRYEWITKNPVCGTKVGAGSGNTCLRPIGEKAVFSIAESKEFISRLNQLPENEINRMMPLKIMLLTGIRISEMCGLRWTDVDFENKVIHVRRNRIYLDKFGIYEKDPKTKTSKREIPLTDALIQDFKKYMDWFRLADDHFDKNLDKYYVAVNIYREPIFPHIIGQWLKKYEEDWGMKHVTCHGLRHTFCSILLSQNVPIQTVSKYMGHSDSTITLKVYSHFIPDTQDKAINALNNIV